MRPNLQIGVRNVRSSATSPRLPLTFKLRRRIPQPSHPTSFDSITIFPPPFPADLRGRRITVMGLGEFGGGEAVVRFLVRRGAIVTLTDLKTESQLAVPLQRLTDEFPAKLRLGQHDLDDFTDADGVVVNPAVKPDNPFVQAAERANVPLTSEIRLFWTNCTAPILGITGTAGKSTTATLVRSLMQAAGIPCRLGGNIGHSLLNELDSLGQAWVILELSSFQLTDLDRGHFSPRIAVVTNFYPNHLIGIPIWRTIVTPNKRFCVGSPQMTSRSSPRMMRKSSRGFLGIRLAE